MSADDKGVNSSKYEREITEFCFCFDKRNWGNDEFAECLSVVNADKISTRVQQFSLLRPQIQSLFAGLLVFSLYFIESSWIRYWTYFVLDCHVCANDV